MSGVFLNKSLWSLWTSEEKNCKERCRPPKNLNGGLVCLGMPNMAHPTQGSQFFLDVLRKDFLTHTPSVHTVHSKKESCFQKSSLDTLGEKWKLAHPTQRQIQLWELDVWWAWAHQLKEVGVSLMRGKDQKGQLLKTCPNNSKACSVIPPFELRRGFWTF